MSNLYYRASRSLTGYKRFLTSCVECGGSTSHKFSRMHEGKCKSCATGIDQTKMLTCPDCGEKRLTPYQKNHGYHCDVCTRNVETTGGIYGY